MGCICQIDIKEKANLEIKQFWQNIQIHSKNLVDICGIFKIKIQKNKEISEEKWNTIIKTVLINNTSEKNIEISTQFWNKQVLKAKESKKENFLILSILFLCQKTQEDLFYMNFIDMCKIINIEIIKENSIKKDLFKDFLKFYFEMITDPFVLESIFDKASPNLKDKEENIHHNSDSIISLINELCLNQENDLINVNSFFTTNYPLLIDTEKLIRIINENNKINGELSSNDSTDH